DVVGNVMGGVAGAPVKGAEVLLGSGPVRKVPEVSRNLTPSQKFKILDKEIDLAEMAGKELPQSKYDELSELLRQKWMDEQGFNVDAYHGTVEFKGDKVLMGDELFKDAKLKGQFYSAKDPKLAEDYTHPPLSHTDISEI